jgi:hypothetical protein
MVYGAPDKAPSNAPISVENHQQPSAQPQPVAQAKPAPQAQPQADVTLRAPAALGIIWSEAPSSLQAVSDGSAVIALNSRGAGAGDLQDKILQIDPSAKVGNPRTGLNQRDEYFGASSLAALNDVRAKNNPPLPPVSVITKDVLAQLDQQIAALSGPASKTEVVATTPPSSAADLPVLSDTQVSRNLHFYRDTLASSVPDQLVASSPPPSASPLPSAPLAQNLGPAGRGSLRNILPNIDPDAKKTDPVLTSGGTDNAPKPGAPRGVPHVANLVNASAV